MSHESKTFEFSFSVQILARLGNADPPLLKVQMLLNFVLKDETGPIWRRESVGDSSRFMAVLGYVLVVSEIYQNYPHPLHGAFSINTY